jgi:hypothetical protein
VVALGILGPISRHEGRDPFDLPEDIREKFAVAPVGGSDFEAHDVHFLHSQINFALGTALADTVLVPLPFTVTQNLQTRRIEHNRDISTTRPTRNLHRQSTRTKG